MKYFVDWEKGKDFGREEVYSDSESNLTIDILAAILALDLEKAVELRLLLFDFLRVGVCVA